jgi:polyvinyl alcohol dehydrogenase (cytochrome)
VRFATSAIAAAVLVLGLATLSQSPGSAAPPAESGVGDAAKSLTARSAEAERSPGAQVYREVCAACHDSGANRAPQRMSLFDMTPEAVLRALTTGAMRQQGSTLTIAQKTAVSEYLSGRAMGSDTSVASLNMCRGTHARFDPNEPPVFAGWGLDPASTHAIPAAVSGLNRENVGRLRLKWAFAFPNSARARSHPALAGGAIIVGNHNGVVYALDRATGCVRWAFAAQSEVRTGIVVSPWRAGDRRAQPLVYFGDVSGNAYAVNARTGTLAWKVRADSHPAAIITGTPTLWQGTLYVPVSSVEEAFATSPGYACCDFRGSILALDARTGRRKWRTWLVAPASVRGNNTNGLEQRGPSGVAVWNSPAIDAKHGQLIFATGDNYSHPGTELSDAIVALDLATGRVKWHYQALAGDTWNVDCVTKTGANCPEGDSPDFDFGAGVVLAAGKNGRDYVLAGQKSGWVYSVDPANGRLAWKRQLGHGSAIGGVHFGMAANDGVIFVPISDMFVSGPDPFPASPGLYALDVASGEFVWKAPYAGTCAAGNRRCHPGYGSTPTTTAGLVMIGADDGRLNIYDAATGHVLWNADTTQSFTAVNGVAGHGGAISGGVAPIAYRGTLIVPSGYGFASKMPGNVLLVYGVE